MRVNPWVNEVLLFGLAECGHNVEPYHGLPLDRASTKQVLIEAVIALGGETLLPQLAGMMRRQRPPHPIWLILENARTPFEILDTANELYPYLNEQRSLRWSSMGPRSVRVHHCATDGSPVSRNHNLLALGFLVTLLEGVGCSGVRVEVPGGVVLQGGVWTPPSGELDVVEVRWTLVGPRPALQGLKSLLAPGVLLPLARGELEQLREHVRRAPAARWTVKRAARALSVPRRTLQRRLAESESTFSEVLWDTRFEVAVSQLSGTERTVAEIAHAAGYSDSSHLARHVRDRKGCTPLELRQRESS